MKIICMGDSITYGYGLEDLTQRWSDLTAQRTGHTLVNRGVSGDTTGGMLARCQVQVFNQHPDAMVFLGGINDIDILGGYRPVCANVIAILRQAELLQLPVIVGLPLPVAPEDMEPPLWDAGRDKWRTRDLCAQYADWLRHYCQDHQLPVADFRAPFLLPDGTADRTLFQDGVHPTPEGHRRMAGVLCQVLAERF